MKPSSGYDNSLHGQLRESQSSTIRQSHPLDDWYKNISKQSSRYHIEGHTTSSNGTTTNWSSSTIEWFSKKPPIIRIHS
jgi:hypothetical protein